MSVKFNAVERGEPGVAGGGNKKYYASAKITGETDLDQLTTKIEKISTVHGADVRAVLYALVDITAAELADSKIVRLGDLGSFKLSLRSNAADTPDAVNASAIKSNKIVFYPGKKLQEMQRAVAYEQA